jgi:hypothetical protein
MSFIRKLFTKDAPTEQQTGAGELPEGTVLGQVPGDPEPTEVAMASGASGPGVLRSQDGGMDWAEPSPGSTEDHIYQHSESDLAFQSDLATAAGAPDALSDPGTTPSGTLHEASHVAQTGGGAADGTGAIVYGDYNFDERAEAQEEPDMFADAGTTPSQADVQGSQGSGAAGDGSGTDNANFGTPADTVFLPVDKDAALVMPGSQDSPAPAQDDEFYVDETGVIEATVTPSAQGQVPGDLEPTEAAMASGASESSPGSSGIGDTHTVISAEATYQPEAGVREQIEPTSVSPEGHESESSPGSSGYGGWDYNLGDTGTHSGIIGDTRTVISAEATYQPEAGVREQIEPTSVSPEGHETPSVPDSAEAALETDADAGPSGGPASDIGTNEKWMRGDSGSWNTDASEETGPAGADAVADDALAARESPTDAQSGWYATKPHITLGGTDAPADSAPASSQDGSVVFGWDGYEEPSTLFDEPADVVGEPPVPEVYDWPGEYAQQFEGVNPDAPADGQADVLAATGGATEAAEATVIETEMMSMNLQSIDPGEGVSRSADQLAVQDLVDDESPLLVSLEEGTQPLSAMPGTEVDIDASEAAEGLADAEEPDL